MKHIKPLFVLSEIIFFLIVFFVNNELVAQTITGKLIDQNGSSLSGLQLKLYISPKIYDVTSGNDGSFTFTNITGINNRDELPTGYNVSDNYPNPFNPRTRIQITLPTNGNVKIGIYNMLGQRVIEDIDRYYSSGKNSIDLELNGLPNGFYIARIILDGKYSITKKLLLLYGSQHLSSPASATSSISGFNKSTAVENSLWDTKIDSLVVTGSILDKKVFTSLPNMSGNFLNLENLIVAIPVPKEPTLVSPENQAVDIQITPALTCTEAKWGTTYNLQVSTSNTFSNFIFDQNNIAKNSFQVTNLKETTTYFWRVSSTNKYGTGPWSSTFSFTTHFSQPVIGNWKLTLVYATINGTVLPITPTQAGIEMSIAVKSNATFQLTTKDANGTKVNEGTFGLTNNQLTLYFNDGTSTTFDYSLNGNIFTIKKYPYTHSTLGLLLLDLEMTRQ